MWSVLANIRKIAKGRRATLSSPTPSSEHKLGRTPLRIIERVVGGSPNVATSEGSGEYRPRFGVGKSGVEGVVVPYRSNMTDARKPVPGFFNPERIIAPPTFNRQRLVLPAVCIHLCLGSVFSWSIMNDLLIRELGVVVSSAGDWTLSSVVPVFSTILALHGISAALLSKWQEDVGPRLSGVLGALTFGGGLMVGGLGVIYHNLGLLYFGYGFLGGLGMGLAYVPPVATLIRWFPDRRGLATGLTIMGFGGGALVATPITTYLVSLFSRAPEFVGPSGVVQLVTQNGRQYVQIGDTLREAVVATTSDVAASPLPGLQEGVYLVGTGSTGAGLALFCLGTGYFAVILLSSLSLRTPVQGYIPPNVTMPKRAPSGLVSSRNVIFSKVLSTPQFWQIWIAFCCLSTAGMAVVSVAKTMMLEIFAKALPTIVTGSFTSGYIMAISAANLSGRLGWSALSDYLGRKTTFTIFFVSSIPLFFAIPFVVESVTRTGSTASLGTFIVITLIIYSMFGAGYATTPAYEADLFGQKYCGAIHGRMLTASATASVVGPMTITYLRSKSELAAIKDLVAQVPQEVFETKFGAPIDQLDTLIKAKTVTINKLMELVPKTTIDPTPFLYNTCMQGAVCLLIIGLISNITIRPLNPKFMMAEEVGPVTEMPPKFTYAVCVDGRPASHAAFEYVLKTMNKETNRLLIIGIDLPHIVAFHQPHWPLLSEDAHIEKRTLLNKYIKLAKEAGIDYSALMLVGPNIGDAICFASKYRKVDLLVLGSSPKKGITTVLGTISKYCADHADCNIMFVKPKPGEIVRTNGGDYEMPGEWARVHEEKSTESISQPINVYEFKTNSTSSK